MQQEQEGRWSPHARPRLTAGPSHTPTASHRAGLGEPHAGAVGVGHC